MIVGPVPFGRANAWPSRARRCSCPAQRHPQPQVQPRRQQPQPAAAAPPSRRDVLLALLPFLAVDAASATVDAGASPLPRPLIEPSKAPDQSKYDPSDPDLREAAALLQRALNAPSVEEEEALWSQVIDTYGTLDKPWVPDVVGRAWGNRGNARSRQGRLQEALSDYNTAIEICPWSVDPVLNRGVALEALGRFDEAVSDYRAVLEANPMDPAGWNNLGNATGGLGRWAEAVDYYGRAAQLAPNFSFASANRAVALFEVGRTEEAIREMRSLLRRYPDFSDMRAALAGALWSIGKEGDAESQWARVDDPRYRDFSWLRRNRRWPPRLTQSLEAFLQLRSLPAPA
ncbi:hypothetical protein PLESTB_000870100 [Pleodorina starrii]|uniref:Tetratricopeptide repeat protein n=1 Tax=Pleodorina starrii TaxID=330485 RepID=A0A9W6BLU5_9CHLO|nr:hypothetical protein PLESTM_002028900 [Pleodorina starrii]GLC54469.1 hypothetical protein PLESTB_000870100 [Pleodorina starrii]GLC76158.1 hypothetical protein PLESTF_001741200 [Pleodorina starrii]